MNVLVAGGSGFVGRSLCRVLIDRGHAVTVASRTPAAVELPAAVETIAVDVTEPGLLFAVAALSICWTMALALAFAYSSLPGTAALVTIPEMIRWHGSVNAFGFALPALIALRLLEA